MTFISNEIKTIEIFENVGDISYKSVKYFIDATENKQDIIRKYVDATTNSSLVIYLNKKQEIDKAFITIYIVNRIHVTDLCLMSQQLFNYSISN
jgi:hypothetical protein